MRQIGRAALWILCGAVVAAVFLGGYCWLHGQMRSKPPVWSHDTVMYRGVPLDISSKVSDEAAYLASGRLLRELLDQYQAIPVKGRAASLVTKGQPWCAVTTHSIFVKVAEERYRKEVRFRLECLAEGEGYELVMANGQSSAEEIAREYARFAKKQL